MTKLEFEKAKLLERNIDELKSAIEIIELIRNSGSQVDEPDNVLGYGIPDFWKAYIIGRMTNDK